MRAAVLVLALALPFCPGCFTLLGAALDGAASRPGYATSTSATAAGAELDARVAAGLITTALHQPSTETAAPRSAASQPLQRRHSPSGYAEGDAFLCSIVDADGTHDEGEVVEASTLENAFEVCVASNDLAPGSACDCRVIREPLPDEG